ncbi:MAG: dihydrofolate reductase [Chitinophagales bacterium]|nr:dihydrofolate reductase [Chitinophagales bacterium]
MVSILVAASENNVIGKGNAIPWRMPVDMRYFKKLTTDNVVIMGRKTYESIGKPLANRANVIVTRKEDMRVAGAFVAHSLRDALEKGKASGRNVFVIGGEEIYKQALPSVDRVYLTRIHAHIDGDAYFPALNKSEWTLISSESNAPDEKNKFACDFEVYQRINN